MVNSIPKNLTNKLGETNNPLFELLNKFMKINKNIIVCLIKNWPSFVDNPYDLIVANINLIRDFGVCDSGIARLIMTGPSILGLTDLIDTLEEVKGLGFDPSTSTFVIALVAKKCMSKKLWDEKVDAFKKWGWSDEDVLEAFKKQPHCMLTSIDKVNSVMSFWVDQLGWDARAIVKLPRVFGSNLERRIIPRAAVLQYLLKNGLLKKKASLTTPFVVSDKLFFERHINRYKEEASYLLKLYEEKLDLAHASDKTDAMS
jgi:mTERF domain-containing protein